jgi:hypothetical protein
VEGRIQEQQANKNRSSKIPGEGLSLNEMLRVMDVAREMRRNRDVAEQMFRLDEVRAEIRAKLMKTASIAGDRVTESEIDAAIDQYFTSLNTYADPPSGIKSALAHVWVWRKKIMAASAAIALAVGGVWYLWLSPNAPLSEAVQTQKAVAAEREQGSQIVEQIKALTTDPASKLLCGRHYPSHCRKGETRDDAKRSVRVLRNSCGYSDRGSVEWRCAIHTWP